MNFDVAEKRAFLGIGRFMWLSTYLTAWDDGACWRVESNGFGCFHYSVFGLRENETSSAVQSTQKHNTVTFARSDLFHTVTCFGQSFCPSGRDGMNLNVHRLVCCGFVWIGPLIDQTSVSFPFSSL
jgi:hypothetical protein